ncbi:hypothetical protein BVRB_7g174480 [Beta vulgaris subsp. vulgaris]|nr:hypothetical protein BVRB_7g174480 [Beta vulgaris subsp. vulgaris]
MEIEIAVIIQKRSANVKWAEFKFLSSIWSALKIQCCVYSNTFIWSTFETGLGGVCRKNEGHWILGFKK